MYLLGTSDDQPVYYTYGNSSWGDQLTAYDGTTISYDASGNPLNWRNVESLTWTGRELTYLYNDSGMSGMYFRYNADGIRTYKSHYDHNTMDMYHVNYVLDGTKIVSESYTHEITNATYTINYYYDANDSVIGFSYNGTDYYYRKNLQGDVIAILNTSGTKVVEYTYTAWGEVLSVTGSLANTIGKINPFRYRGYYYDTETGFYYLQTRYYDPVVGRFLNADSAGAIGDHTSTFSMNQFAYCYNNPMHYYDPDGEFALTLSFLGWAVAVLIVGTVATITAVKILSDPAVQRAIARAVADIGNVVKSLAKSLAESIEEAFEKAKSKVKSNTYAKHHIVAKAAPLAQYGRDCLAKVKININDSINLVSIKQNLHYFVHTSAYYLAVNALLRPAFGNRDKTISVLALIRAELLYASEMMP